MAQKNLYLCIAKRSKTPRVEVSFPSVWRCFMSIRKKDSSPKREPLSRLWFMARGCKQVPLDLTGGIIRWAHPDGYFLNEQGQKVPDDNRNPSSINPTWKSHGCYPKDRATNKLMHHLMALTYYGDRPIFTDKNGKTYVGICHHLIPDKLDYRPANLLCWLDREQHNEADRRQSELRKVLPDMYAISYEKHRYLQDPRVTSLEVFDVELDKIRLQYGDNA